MGTMNVHVDSYPGDGAELPRRFRLRGRHVGVVEIVDRWHGCDPIYFKVTGDDGSLYILRHDEVRAEWELTMFASLRAQAIPVERQKRPSRPI